MEKDTGSILWKRNLTSLMKEKNKGKCELCGKEISKHNIHHTDYNNVNISTTMFVCISCHKFIHNNGLDTILKIRQLLPTKTDTEISKILNIHRLRIFRMRRIFLIKRTNIINN